MATITWVLVLTSISLASQSVGAASLEHLDYEPQAPMPYEYGYGVNFPYTGDAKEHKEVTSKSGRTEGEYRWLQPNGLYRVVRYYIEGPSGFIAEVTEEEGPDVTNYVSNKLTGEDRETDFGGSYNREGSIHTERERENLGLQGFQDSKQYSGSHGFQSSQGFKSSQKFHNAKEVQHSQEYSGFQGFQGSQGYQSSQEHQRSQGLQTSPQTSLGFKGHQASQGLQSSQTFLGSQGYQTSQGFLGSQKFQGSPEFQQSRTYQESQESQKLHGSQGFQGSHRHQDSTGYQGLQQFLGSQGRKGHKVFSGSHFSKLSGGVTGFNGKLSQSSYNVGSLEKHENQGHILSQKNTQGYQRVEDQRKHSASHQLSQGNLGLLNQNAVFLNANAVQGRNGYSSTADTKTTSSMYVNQPIYKKNVAHSSSNKVGLSQQQNFQNNFKTSNALSGLGFQGALGKSKEALQSLTNVHSNGNLNGQQTYGLKLSSSQSHGSAKTSLDMNLLAQSILQSLANAQHQGRSSYSDHGSTHSQEHSNLAQTNIKMVGYDTKVKSGSLQGGLNGHIRIMPMQIASNNPSIISQVLSPQVYQAQGQQIKKHNHQNEASDFSFTAGNLSLNQKNLSKGTLSKQYRLGASSSSKDYNENHKVSHSSEGASKEFVLSNSYLPPPPAGNAGILNIEGEASLPQSYVLPNF